MEKRKPYYFLSLSLVFIFFSKCSEVNQSISSADINKKRVQEEPLDNSADKEHSSFNAFISIFDFTADNEEPIPTEFSAHYLDSATNNLFNTQVEISRPNPYGFKIDELVSYPDSIYEQRIQAMSSEIDLSFNEQVANFIDLYAVRKKELTERMMGKSLLYFPFIEQALMEQGLPQELKFLTMVESALHADAQSSMEAVGLWQIRYRTGKWLGLEINNYLDERRDPYASTLVAVQYLDRLHDIYGSWPMALAAYNSGPGNLNKAIVRAGGSRDYWKIRDYLPLETQSYVPAFMALVYVNEFSQEHNIRAVIPELPFQAVDTVRIFQEASFDQLAHDLDMSISEIAFLNPALIKNKVPFSHEGWPLVLPMNKMATFEENAAELTAAHTSAEDIQNTAQVLREVVPQSPELKLLEHIVSSGQTMDGISRRYDVSLSQIRAWNAMRDDIIRVGQTLKIYLPEDQLVQK